MFLQDFVAFISLYDYFFSIVKIGLINQLLFVPILLSLFVRLFGCTPFFVFFFSFLVQFLLWINVFYVDFFMQTHLVN